MNFRAIQVFLAGLNESEYKYFKNRGNRCRSHGKIPCECLSSLNSPTHNLVGIYDLDQDGAHKIATQYQCEKF